MVTLINIVTDHVKVINVWKDHFEALGQSRKNVNEIEKEADIRAKNLLSDSFKSKNEFLDIPFEHEELEYALNKFKLNQSADPIGITAEHLIYGGHHLELWLLQVINAMVDHKTIPECINLATVTPVYKGSVKHPLD